MTRRTAGFTLIELLVAVAILAVIAVLSWRGLDGVLRARTALSEELKAVRGLQAAFNQIDADLRAAARDPNVNSTLPGVLFGQGQMMLLRYQFGDIAGRWHWVRYTWEQGQLQRRSVALNDMTEVQRWQSTPSLWNEVPAQALVGAVRGLSWAMEPSGPGPDAGVARLALAQSLGQVVQQPRWAVLLTLELDNGERFVRRWLVRE